MVAAAALIPTWGMQAEAIAYYVAYCMAHARDATTTTTCPGLEPKLHTLAHALGWNHFLSQIGSGTGSKVSINTPSLVHEIFSR